MGNKTLKFEDAFGIPQRGRGGLSKTYIRENRGEYPVFSASTAGPMGHIATYDFEGPHLSWSTNGYAGTMRVLDGRFSITSDRAIATARFPGLNLSYCRLALEPKFRAAARGRVVDGKKNEYTKLTAALVRDIEFDVPTTATGEFDEVAQQAYVDRYMKIETFQKKAIDLSKLITVALPRLNLEGKETKAVSLTDESVFQFLRMETSWGKKDWHTIAVADDTAGAYPVYSAAKGPVAYVSIETDKLIRASEERPILSFAVDGDSSAGGNLVVHRKPFYISTNRACLRNVNSHVLLDYVFHALSTMKADHGFSYSYKAYKAHLNDVMVEIPVDDSGEFDMAEQRAVALRRSKLLKLRDGAIRVLQSLGSVKVEAQGIDAEVSTN